MAAVLDFNKITLTKKIRIGLGFSLLLLIATSVIAYLSIREQIYQSAWVDHTNQVRLKLEAIVSILRDAETGQRGYILTSQSDFLDSYNGANSNVQNQLKELKELTKDNPTQQQHLIQLTDLIQRRLERMDAVLNIYKTNKLVSADDMMAGKALMKQSLAVVTNMQLEEMRLLEMRSAEAELYSRATPIVIIVSSLFAILVSGFSFYFITKDIATKERTQAELARLNADLEHHNEEITRSRNDLDRHNYLLNGSAKLNDLLRSDLNLEEACQKILEFLCQFTKSQAGVFYLLSEQGNYQLNARYAIGQSESLVTAFKPGDGLLGQSVISLQPVLTKELPAESLQIKSGLTATSTVNSLIVPFHYNGHAIALVELINRNLFEDLDQEFVTLQQHTIAIVLSSILAEIKQAELLSETQNQAEELESQQEELRHINEEIREQRDRLQASEEELKASEEELQEKNAELEEKTNELEEQYESIRIKNQELENAREAVQLKMDQLETVSKYKSEFLANMSHELRTPLNSILILAKILKDNPNRTLTQKESEHAGVIERSGNDLLKLINEILDLARIESGKVNLEISDVAIADMDLEAQFHGLAIEKNIRFSVSIRKDVPPKVQTDKFRVEQVLKNLLSNAFKFTPKGKEIECLIHLPEPGTQFARKELQVSNTIAFSVRDTGIGIPEEKKAVIFEAFQQADVSTTRKFGGSGLGLTISRDLAALLGGEIQMSSVIGEGSVFTLYIPLKYEGTEARKPDVQALPRLEEPVRVFTENPLPKPPADTSGNGKIILIIEDDFYFCNILADYAEKKGYSVYSANTGAAGMRLAASKRPDAILLDIQLPDENGWNILKKLKSDPSLRNIPVHLMSAYDKEGNEDLGQENFIPKPVTLEVLDNALGKIRSAEEKSWKTVLVVEDNQNENQAIKELLATQNVHSVSAYSGKDAWDMMSKASYDCIILDINLPDMSGYSVLEKIKTSEEFKNIPVIIYSGKDLTEKEEAAFRKYANTIIIKTEYSYTRLLEEVKLFLYNVEETLGKLATSIKEKPSVVLSGKKVIIADDDMRNVYSLTNVLEQQGMEVLVAYDGREALEELKANPDVHIVLMDIMMPEMDGIEATKEIRKIPEFINLPIIAVTAKALPGDKENCLAAGVSDYISKPIDITKLISLMQVWLYDNRIV